MTATKKKNDINNTPISPSLLLPFFLSTSLFIRWSFHPFFSFLNSLKHPIRVVSGGEDQDHNSKHEQNLRLHAHATDKVADKWRHFRLNASRMITTTGPYKLQQTSEFQHVWASESREATPCAVDLTPVIKDAQRWRQSAGAEPWSVLFYVSQVTGRLAWRGATYTWRATFSLVRRPFYTCAALVSVAT